MIQCQHQNGDIMLFSATLPTAKEVRVMNGAIYRSDFLDRRVVEKV